MVNGYKDKRKTVLSALEQAIGRESPEKGLIVHTIEEHNILLKILN